MNSIEKPDAIERVTRALSAALMSMVKPWMIVSWEDFLDFSRMAPPSNTTPVRKRMIINIGTRYYQQYIMLIHLFLSLIGLCYCRYIFMSLIFSGMIWLCIFVGVFEYGLFSKGRLFKTTSEVVVSILHIKRITLII